MSDGTDVRAGDVDALDARQYMRLLFDRVPGTFELRPIVPDGAARPTFHASIDSALREISRAAASALNVYVGVASRGSGENGSKLNLRACRALWVDFDGDPGDLDKLLAEFPFQPSLLVHSGAGAHTYWLLEEPFILETAEQRTRFEHVLKGLADALDGDRSATDASRILRVPGTVNYPDQRKRARGRVPAPCRLEAVSGELYDFDNFEAFELRGRELSSESGSETYEQRAWDGALPERVDRILQSNAKVCERFDRTPGDHADKSESGIDFSLACLLAVRSCEGWEIEAALRASRAQANLRAERDDYFQRTVGRAMAFVEEQRGQPNAPQAAFETTDLANAHRIARHFRDELRWAKGFEWLCWAGTHWKPSTTRALQLASRLGRIIHGEASEAERRAAESCDEQKRLELAMAAKARIGWAKTSEGEAKIRAALNLARPLLEIDVEQLDADPWALNVRNGTLDLRTGQLRPHRREDLITKVVSIDYDPEARSELWERFLKGAIPDTDTRHFFHKGCGYSLAGLTGEDVLLVVHGPPRTGKGTAQDAVASALGDYAMTAGLEDFRERDRGGGPRPELVRLRGARMVSVYETSSRLRLSASLVKTLCGSDPVTARPLYQEPITFRPQFTLWVATNHRPRVPDDDEALWGRIRELPFDTVIPPDERDPDVRATLRDPEISGAAILRWAVEGCLLWQKEGLVPPDIVNRATEDYRAEMDPLRGFLEECCVLEPGAWTPAAPLRDAYESYARSNGDRPVGSTRWGNGLRAHGCTRKRQHSGRGWLGIGLLAGEGVTA